MDNCCDKVIDHKSELTTACHFSAYYTAEGVSCDPAINQDTGPSSLKYFSAHDVVYDDESIEHTKTEPNMQLEREIEASKVHWSERSSDWDSDGDVESNREIYERLRLLPKYQQWLNIYGVKSSEDIVFGQKLAEGGQAEIFEADDCCKTLGNHFSYVLKVFKKGFSLRHLQQQWPEGVLSSHKYVTSGVQGGMVLEDDRFAFLLKRRHIDLRKIIDIAQENNSPLWNEKGRPFKEFRTYEPRIRSRRCPKPIFSDKCAQSIMLKIACEMLSLHTMNVLHRDLKTSNILCNDFDDDQIGRTRSISMHLADYESSLGVLGTGFWRAPEILQQLKEGKSNSKIQFTREADVYAYAMTCYEILTGCIPFEGCKGYDYDKVLNGARPTLPDYVPTWIKDLIHSCWRQNPSERPTFRTIPEEIKAHGIQLYSIVLEGPNKTSLIAKILQYSMMQVYIDEGCTYLHQI